MGTRCESVEAYLAKEKRGKKVVYILNKVDLVPGWVAVRPSNVLLSSSAQLNLIFLIRPDGLRSFPKLTLQSLSTLLSTTPSEKDPSSSFCDNSQPSSPTRNKSLLDSSVTPTLENLQLSTH